MLGVCFFCNKNDNGVIALPGRIDAEDSEAPRRAVIDFTPCPECKGFMEQGVILISVREPKNEEEECNPYRTGGWVVVKEEFIKRVVQPEDHAKAICKKRVAFIPDEAWNALGLPKAVREHQEKQEEKYNASTKSSGDKKQRGPKKKTSCIGRGGGS